ncbi:MAG: hypothetical protein L3J32_11105, partial [Rhizobiaceae bacterium]|nr:hypothetical protein [Rhizobiaceae bacterium]
TCGADVSFMRNRELADDLTGMLPVARWVLQQFDKRGEHFDDVFILFPAAPLLEAEDLIGAYAIYQSHNRKRNLISVSEAPAFAEWFFKRSPDGRLKPLHPGGAFLAPSKLTPAYYETGSFTIFSREWLLSSKTLSDDDNYISYELPRWKAVDIDTMEDLEHADLLFKAMKSRRARKTNAAKN